MGIQAQIFDRAQRFDLFRRFYLVAKMGDEKSKRCARSGN